MRLFLGLLPLIILVDMLRDGCWCLGPEWNAVRGEMAFNLAAAKESRQGKEGSQNVYNKSISGVCWL
jgi:hypothetical protein